MAGIITRESIALSLLLNHFSVGVCCNAGEEKEEEKQDEKCNETIDRPMIPL